MGQFGHPAMTDRRRGTLERVRRPEDFVDHARIDALLEDEQALFDSLDLLQRFVREQTIVTLLQIEGQVHLRQPLAGLRGV